MHLFKKFNSLYNSHNTNANSITEISQRKILDIKSPFKINNIIRTPGIKISKKNLDLNINKNNEKISHRKTIQTGKKETQEKNKYFIHKINGLKNKIFISDSNNKKIKFIKK